MNNNFYKIYSWMVKDLELKGNELLLFAYLYSWVEYGKDCTETQEQITEKVGISRRTYSNVVCSIVQKLHNENVQKLPIDVCKNCTKIVQKLHKKCAKIAHGMCKNCTYTIHNNIQDKQDKQEGARTHAREGEKKEDVRAKEERRAEIILDGIKQQYEDNGEVYVPNWSKQTTAVSSLCKKVVLLLESNSHEDTDENFRKIWSQFLQRGYTVGDQFDRVHWTLDYIDNQFMTILNKIKNGNSNKISSNSGNTAKGQRRISNNVLKRKMLVAAGLVQSGTYSEDVQGSENHE